jgi:uncharacterized protein (DUF885 family)
MSRYDGVTELHDLFDRHWRHLMEDLPELATYTGWHEHHDRWTDMSADAVERRRREAGDALAALRTIDRDFLSDADKLSYDLFEAQERMAVDAARFPAELLPLDQLEGPQNDVPFLLSAMPTQTDAQLGDYLSRLRAIPAVLEQTCALMDRGLAAGLSVPAICLRDVPEQIDAHLDDDVFTSPELTPLAGAPQAARDEAAALMREQIQPAFRALREYVTGTYTPAARETIAFTDVPDGEEWYAERVRYHTTTDMTPKQIHEMGMAEVGRITAAMQSVMEEIGFSGSKDDFAEHLRTDPRFYFESPDALLAFYRDIAKRIDPAVPSLFRLMPRLPYGIVAVPPEQAPSAPAAFYLQGSVHLGRAGMFYANTYDLSARPSWNMESICLHEAVPGHHFQITLAQEMEDLPEFRKQSLHCTAYIEGWGLYCESLGADMGMYTDPYQRYGALDAELLRAIRLVTDSGMHAFGWTRERAIDFFLEHSPMPKHEIVSEVDRYIVLPGQALAYKVGELEIQALRRRAAERLGDAFDVRGFHDEVLRHGALPLGVLSSLVDGWIASAA